MSHVHMRKATLTEYAYILAYREQPGVQGHPQLLREFPLGMHSSGSPSLISNHHIFASLRCFPFGFPH